MGKKRIAIVSDQPKKERKIVKTGKEHGRITDMGKEALAEAEVIKEKEKRLKKELSKKTTKKAKKEIKKRGLRYLEARKKIDKTKLYPLSEAIKLAKSVSISNFNGSLDVHLNVKKIGLKGEVKLPHSTGKNQVIRIADDQLIKELEQGKVNFNILISNPQMMPKLTKFAKLLGPKGLMPNPKNNTISEEPEKLAKELEGKTQFKTENKAPLIHLTIGKIDFPQKKLEENFSALIKAVGKKNIKKAVLAPTMGPGIKVDLGSI